MVLWPHTSELPGTVGQKSLSQSPAPFIRPESQEMEQGCLHQVGKMKYSWTDKEKYMMLLTS